MAAYYNENDPAMVAWLRELIKEGHIADGEVDDRSITDVSGSDLRGFTQCHFFAGLGGWSYALRLAGWPDDREVWTGSCPCQPWSMAGKGEGADDPRHLWPAWFRLIEECRPPVVFGEQTSSEDGRYWLDLVYASMEGADYAVGSAVLPAAGVGAPHGRHRIWFVGSLVGLADHDGRDTLHGVVQRSGRHHRVTQDQAAREVGLADFNGHIRRANGGGSHGRSDGRHNPSRRSVVGAGVVQDDPTSGGCGIHRIASRRSGHVDVANGDGVGQADTRHPSGRTNDSGGHDLERAHGVLSGGAEAASLFGECGEVGSGVGQADAMCERRQQIAGSASRDEGSDGREPNRHHVASSHGSNSGVALGNATSQRCPIGDGSHERVQHTNEGHQSGDGQAITTSQRRERRGTTRRRRTGSSNHGHFGEAQGFTISEGLERHSGDGDGGDESGRIRSEAAGSTRAADHAGFWADVIWLPCTDGKARPTQPGIFPVAPRLPGDVALLRGSGNSIVPEVAAIFIEAFQESVT